METVLIVIHLMIVVALAVVVLLQRSEGGALGMGGGGGGFMTGRGQANALTRATAILGTLFFITSLGLTFLANTNRAPRSIFDGVAPAGETAPGQPGGSLLDQLRQNEAPAQQAPAAPAVPQPPRQ